MVRLNVRLTVFSFNETESSQMKDFDLDALAIQFANDRKTRRGVLGLVSAGAAAFAMARGGDAKKKKKVVGCICGWGDGPCEVQTFHSTDERKKAMTANNGYPGRCIELKPGTCMATCKNYAPYCGPASSGCTCSDQVVNDHGEYITFTCVKQHEETCSATSCTSDSQCANVNGCRCRGIDPYNGKGTCGTDGPAYICNAVEKQCDDPAGNKTCCENYDCDNSNKCSVPKDQLQNLCTEGARCGKNGGKCVKVDGSWDCADGGY
jgi:hypothetical protein